MLFFVVAVGYAFLFPDVYFLPGWSIVSPFYLENILKVGNRGIRAMQFLMRLIALILIAISCTEPTLERQFTSCSRITSISRH